MKWGVGTVFMGVVACSLIIQEWDFGQRARSGQAVVIESAAYGRSGQTIADVNHVVEGQRIRATLRVWYCRLRPGQKVRVLYPPSDPENVWPDWFWQRHFCSTIAVAVFTILAGTETLRIVDWRRRQAVPLAREDYVGPQAATQRIPSLQIDLSPPLWDRDLDG